MAVSSGITLRHVQDVINPVSTSLMLVIYPLRDERQLIWAMPMGVMFRLDTTWPCTHTQTAASWFRRYSLLFAVLVNLRCIFSNQGIERYFYLILFFTIVHCKAAVHCQVVFLLPDTLFARFPLLSQFTVQFNTFCKPILLLLLH